jgi:hypothetical protein
VNPRYELRLIELLTEIRDHQRQLLRLFEETRRPAPSDARYTELVRAIAKSAVDRVFSSAELVAHCEVTPELADAITAAVGGLNARKVGRALRRVEGMDLDGLIVTRVGSDSNGVSWRITRG